jgi:DNA-binding transcriptional LysR family regulator
MEDSIPMLARGDLDVVMVNDWDTEPLPIADGIVKAPLLDDVFDLVLPAGHRLAGKTEVDLAEMDGEAWIAWSKNSICNKWLMRTLRGLGIEPAIKHTVEDHHTQMTLVAAGLGSALLPRIGRPIPSEDVRVVELRPSLVRHIYAITRKGATRRPAIRAVRDALRDVSHPLGKRPE